jgi:hypothetical protein
VTSAEDDSAARTTVPTEARTATHGPLEALVPQRAISIPPSPLPRRAPQSSSRTGQRAGRITAAWRDSSVTVCIYRLSAEPPTARKCLQERSYVILS